jgi:hypothetical protein
MRTLRAVLVPAHYQFHLFIDKSSFQRKKEQEEGSEEICIPKQVQIKKGKPLQ